MIKSDRKTIGVIIDWPGTEDKYQRKILMGIQAFAEERDLNLIILSMGRINSPFHWEREKNRLLDFLNPVVFDGLISFSAAITNFCDVSILAKKLFPCKDLPMVSIGQRLSDSPTVLMDNSNKLKTLVEHLIQHHGYKKLAFVGGPIYNPDAKERWDTVKKTTQELGVPIGQDYYFEGSFLLHSGIDAVKYFLDEKKVVPDAIIFANDEMAIGAWQELWKRKIAVPEDIVLTGFDNHQVSQSLGLTTISQPFFQQGYTAAEGLLHLIEKGKLKWDNNVIKLDTQMELKDSCGCTPWDGEFQEKEEPQNHDGAKVDQLITLLEKAVKNHKEKELRIYWSQFLFQAIEKAMTQSELEKILFKIQLPLNQLDLSSAERKRLNSIYSAMKHMLFSRYSQAELITSRENEKINFDTLFALDHFEQYSVANSSEEIDIKELEKLLVLLGVENCYISHFVHDSNPQGRSRLLLAYHKGRALKIPRDKEFFKSSYFMNPNFYPQEAFQLVVNPIFKGEEYYGFIIFDSISVSFQSQDMINRSLNNVFHGIHTNRNLILSNMKLEKAMNALETLSISDELTGLYNRRGFMTLSDQLLKVCKREKDPALILYGDMNGLKFINDNFGHSEGDFAIKTTANILRETFREADVLSRLGGDEFTVFLANAHEDQMPILMQRLDEITALVNKELKKEYRISISIGFCQYSEEKANSIKKMMEEADEQMYQMKIKNKHRGK
ncbi:MAG: GGDEF domain-containing protein [Spirochaetaceae bacterium]|jgi:diguanylate cyclase (GGDEF)-like protein|nr:GGDEF domain-containing protein [Spirochaetaceae bacterium]